MLAVSQTGDIYGQTTSTDSQPTLSVIEPVTHTVVATITVGSETTGMQVSATAVSPTGPDAGDIYAVGQMPLDGNLNFKGLMQVIDPQTNAVVASVGLASGPSAVAISPTGPDTGDIYLVDNTSISVIEPGANNAYTVVATIPIASTDNGTVVSGTIGAIAVSATGPDAGDIFVAHVGDFVNNQGTNIVSVIEPGTNNTYTVADNITGVAGTTSIAVSPTGPEAGDIYATGESRYVSVIDPSTNAIVATVDLNVNNSLETTEADGQPNNLVVSPTGPEAGDIYTGVDNAGQNGNEAAVEAIDPATNKVVAVVPVSGTPEGMAVSPTGTEAGYIYAVTPTRINGSVSDVTSVLKP